MPRWTVPSFERTPGRYPLGTEAVALNQLATQLASGLPVQSRQPRYWSIYTYIVQRFWESKRSPQNNAALGRFLKPRETIFACAALVCPRHGELPGIVGRDTFVPWLRNHPDDDLPLDLRYLQQPLGGYGQIYRGAMADLGLILLAENNPEARLDAPFGELGSAVAESFGAAIATTTYAKRYADRDAGTIPLGVVRELAEASCFCRLVEHEPERDLLADVLLGRKQPGSSHRDRADTIRMFLDLAGRTHSTPLDESRYRRLLYFGGDGDGCHWQAPQAIEPMRRRWWLIQLREFVVGALNALFVDFARWGIEQGGLLRPVPVETYLARIEGLELPNLAGLPSGSMSAVHVAEVVVALDTVVTRGGWPLASSASDAVNELEVASRSDRGLSDLAPATALLTLLLAQRRLAFINREQHLTPTEEAMLRDGGLARLSTYEVFDWLASRSDEDRTLAEVVVELLRIMVIRQHLRVAREKLPEDTFRFHEEQGGFRFVDHGDEGVSSISIRFLAISTALYGLGLVSAPLTEAEHAPTPRGLEIANG
jgi:hypothetical protein